MDDSNELLRRILRQVHRVLERQEHADLGSGLPYEAHMLACYVDDLHSLLISGGPLPEAWDNTNKDDGE